MRMTYLLKIKNDQGWVKTVYVTAPSFMDAVKKMQSEHGGKWVVLESAIVCAE